MFETQFPKRRPEWLRLSPRSLLELDGYSEELAVAFEYQGTQHYEALPFLSNYDVEAIQRRDAEKRRRCWDRHVSLIQISEFSDLKNVEAVINQIELAVLQAGLKIPKTWKKRRPKTILATWIADAMPIPDEIYRKMEKIGWTCVSETYAGYTEPMVWKCARGHERTSSWGSIKVKKDNWCIDCRAQDIMEDARNAARALGGNCISKDFWKGGLPEFECAKGHTWFAVLGKIKRGQWCASCYHESRKIENKVDILL